MPDDPRPQKGHWPAGKRRNPDGGTWSRVLLTLQSLVEEYHEPCVRSRQQVARDLAVSDRSVRRWLDGTDVPDEATQMAVRQWCAAHVAAIKAARTKRKESTQ